MKRVLTTAAVLVLASALGATRPAGQQTAPATGAAAARPRLVVVLVVDQFRSDYARTYGQQWTKGLRRLMTRGAVFPLGAFPYAYTVTCPGHATIATGAPPSVHGMIGNDWFDRGRGRSIACTDDQTAVSAALGGATGTERHSLRLLRTATLADEIRRQHAASRPRIAAVSLKARSALTLAGQPSPDTVAIWEEDNGTWASSTVYAKPPAAVDAFVRANPVTAAYGQRWARLLPRSAFLFEDDVPHEPPPHVFPHVLDSSTGRADNSFVTRWERSPKSDEYTLDIALRLIDALDLGRRDTTDVLGISFSALDLVGHRFGPRSHEVQDVLARLDVFVGRLLEALDRAVGPDRYVLGFSSDHGVAPVPEQATAQGLPAGRFTTTSLRQAAEAALVTTLGIGRYVAGTSSQHIYLHQGVPERIANTAGATRQIEDALYTIPAVARVFWASELAATTPTADGLLRAARLSYVPGRSGDIVVIPRPYWMAQATGTTHGTPYLYDQEVPVVLFGAGVKPGRYYVPAAPLDLAPTLASLAGIVMPQATGRVLREALRGRAKDPPSTPYAGPSGPAGSEDPALHVVLR